MLSYRVCLESHRCQENILSRDVIADVIVLKISVIARTIDDRGWRQKGEGTDCEGIVLIQVRIGVRYSIWRGVCGHERLWREHL